MAPVPELLVEIMTDVKSRSKAKRIVEERNLAAYASDTKWAEFFRIVCDQKIELEIKYINSEVPGKAARVWVPTGNYVETAEMGPVLYVFIEWVRSVDIAGVSALARTVGLEYSVESKKVVVYGYR